MNIELTENAIIDIATYYGNVARAYPNAWSDEDVDIYIDKTIDNIVESAKQYIIEKEPLLNTLKQDRITEPSPTKDGKWYFTAYYDFTQSQPRKIRSL